MKLSEAPSFGKPAVFYDPSNRGSKSYLDLSKEFEKRFSNKNNHEVVPQTGNIEDTVPRETNIQETEPQSAHLEE